ncbi:MAG: glycerol-3-phosphate dehydrogenase/oxidase [Alphaproteobacteria bacterium]|nr:glycerol-3-phosphate dehydrogenase/oxidase [Alphaproteobacteria bacterium]
MTDDTVKEFDVVIIGAGVNGAGLFRDLCAQGLRCLIVDKGDFCSGTSAAPSRLIHGGLKYLETGEFRLVAESTYERNLLLRNAAHLVRPLPTFIPILSWTKGISAAIRTFLGSKTAPRSRGALLIKIGLQIYDMYGSRAGVMPRHRMIGRRKALAEIPALTPAITAVGTYYDAAITAPERLVLELVKDGLALSGESEALNWCPVVGQRDSEIELCLPGGEKRVVSAELVVNAAGPWIDRVNAILGIGGTLIGGTRGAHILLHHPELVRQLDDRMIYFEGDDGRILLVFVYEGRAMVGSTDIAADDPDSAVCTDDEVEYFLRSLRDVLPGLDFDESQIVYSYSGIRPLPHSSSVAPGLISRDHCAPLEEPNQGRPFPVISLVGGKWTTFRAFSADVADMVLNRLKRQRKVSTDDMPIGGGQDLPKSDRRGEWVQNLASRSGASRQRVEQLLERYGSTAADIADWEGEGMETLSDAPDFSHAEIDWIVRHELVEHLEDILLRRTSLAITGRLTPDMCGEVCSLAGAALGWDAERQEAELKMFSKNLSEKHRVDLF